MLSRVSRTVLDTLVPRIRAVSGPGASCARSGNTGTGSLTPEDARSGLAGPMPTTIALVVVGRCRPSPDRVSLGAPADRDARRIVSAGLAGATGRGAPPVLGAPCGGVSGIDGDDRDAGRVGHRGEAGTELAGGHAGDQ